MAVLALNATSAVLSLTAFTFFLIAVIGYSNDNTTVENVNWFHQNGTGSDLFIGLSRVTVKPSSGPTQAFIYEDCTGDLCNTCEKQGTNAFALLVISTIFSFITLALSVAASVVPSSEISGTNIATSFVATVFGVIGWGLFVNKCFVDKIEDQVNGDFDYGPGAVMGLIAFLLTFVVFVLQIVATALSKPVNPPGSADSRAAVVTRSEPAVPTNEL